MNDRIKELAKQAYEDVIKNTPSFLVTKEMYEEKFAELIVRECIGLCMNVNGDLPRTEPLVAASIKKHFGVE